MKNVFYYLLGLCIAVAIMVACTTSGDNKPHEEVVFGVSAQQSYNINKAEYRQIDSIIHADDLPDFNLWLKSDFVDYETGKKITKRLCIRKDLDTEVVYVVTGTTYPYIITKRVTK